MELKKIQEFLNNHVSAEWFDVDLILYEQKFPSSRILNDLKNAINFQKQGFDERICYELMQDGGVCDCAIWENRGFTIDANGLIVPLTSKEEPTDFEKQLLELDLDQPKPKYNDIKALVFGLKLAVSDQLIGTYIEALTVKKAELIAKFQPKPVIEPDTKADADVKTDAPVVETKPAADVETDASVVETKTNADAKADTPVAPVVESKQAADNNAEPATDANAPAADADQAKEEKKREDQEQNIQK